MSEYFWNMVAVIIVASVTFIAFGLPILRHFKPSTKNSKHLKRLMDIIAILLMLAIGSTCFAELTPEDRVLMDRQAQESKILTDIELIDKVVELDKDFINVRYLNHLLSGEVTLADYERYIKHLKRLREMNARLIVVQRKVDRYQKFQRWSQWLKCQ